MSTSTVLQETSSPDNCFHNPLAVFSSATTEIQSLTSEFTDFQSSYADATQRHQDVIFQDSIRPDSPYSSDTDSHRTERVKTRKPRGRRVATTENIDSSLLASGKKLFICNEPQCGKVFKRAEHLSRHHRMHSGERPYPCSECDKAFSRSDNLSAHMARAHKNVERKFPTPRPTPFQYEAYERPSSAMSFNYSSITPSPSPRPLSAMSTSSYPELSFTPALPQTPALTGLRDYCTSPYNTSSGSAQEYPMLYAPAPRQAGKSTDALSDDYYPSSRWML